MTARATCQWCDREFPPESTSRRRFCSGRCRSAAWRARRRGRLWTAVHEAGHALVADELGRHVSSVSLEPSRYTDPQTGELRISGGHVSLAPLRTRPGSGTRRRREDLERGLVVLAAGAAALELLGLLPTSLRAGDTGDYADACAVARELLGPDASEDEVDARVRAALEPAREILARKRGLLPALAASYAEGRTT